MHVSFQASRWALVCTICKERTGACIQCSVKACKTAFHVTCGFANNLEMKTILIEDTDDDDDAVKLKVTQYGQHDLSCEWNVKYLI